MSWKGTELEILSTRYVLYFHFITKELEPQ